MDGEVIDLVSSDEEAAAGSPATGRTGRRSLGRRQSGAGTQSTTAPLNESLDTPPTAKRRRDAWSLPSSSTGWSPAESHAGRAAASPARSFVGAGAGAGCGSADASLSDEVTVELGASLGGGDSDDEEPMPLRARLARRVDSSRLAAVQDGSGSDLVTPRRRDTTPVHQGGSGARFEPEMGSPAIDLTQDGGGSVGPDDSDDATMHLSFGISPVGTPPITTPRTARRSERRGSVARRPYSGVGTPTNKRPRTSAADDSSSDGDGADDFGAQPLIERINTQKRAAALSQGISSQVAAMRVSPKEGSAARRRGALIATAAASGGMRAQRAGGRGTSSGLKRSLSAAPSTPARHRTGATPASEASGARLHSGSRTRRSSERRLRAGAGAGAGRSPGVGTPEGALSFPPAVCVVADVARAAPGCDVDALLSPSGPDSGGDGAGRVEELTTPRTRKQREVLQRREEAARKRAEKAQTKRSAKHSKFVVRQQQGRFGSREVCLVLSKEMAKGDLGSALHAGLADVYKDAFPGDAPITRQIETESRPRGVKFAAWERRTMHFAGGAEVLSNKARWVNLAFIVLRGSQLVDAFVRGGRDLCARLTRACVEALPSATIRPVVLVIDAKGAVSEKQLEFQRVSARASVLPTDRRPPYTASTWHRHPWSRPPGQPPSLSRRSMTSPLSCTSFTAARCSS